MVVSENKVISLTYELRLAKDSEKVIEAVTEERPLQFIYGKSNLLPKFEENLSGLNLGDGFDFGLTSQDAYGPINTEAIVEVPVAAFEVNGSIDQNLLKPGNMIPMQDGAGNKLNGIVKEVTEQNVKMDFNHPLAGEGLQFAGKVVDIREATTEELMYGLSSGGCGCSSGCGCDSPQEQQAGQDACGCGSGCGCG